MTSVKPSQHEPSVSIPIWEVPIKESNLCPGSLILGSELKSPLNKHTHKQITLGQKPKAIKTTVEIDGIQGFTGVPLFFCVVRFCDMRKAEEKRFCSCHKIGGECILSWNCPSGGKLRSLARRLTSCGWSLENLVRCKGRMGNKWARQEGGLRRKTRKG